MKKVYTKPEIAFENFSLNTNIAGDCDRIVGSPSKGSCGIQGSAPGITLFSDTVNGCNFLDDGDDMYDGYCYHVPDEAFTLFNS